MMFDDDLVPQLQDLNRKPSIMDLPNGSPIRQWKSRKGNENEDPNRKQTSLIDPSFEYIDPTPDVHAMFLQFNSRFFWGKLYSVEVRWSPRMTSCAGVCCYEGRGGLCSVRLSAPLLKLRPRKDLVETLLHEMIHAFLFVTNNDRDRDGHGPEFHKHMYRINKEAGTKISVYHNFHDEVKLYQQHWWRCNGPCQKWRPYFGMVKRAMNRPPGPSDFWWANHQAKCGGTYTKVREPEGFSKKKTSHASVKGNAAASNKKNDIRNLFPFMGEGKALSTGSSHGEASSVFNGKYSSGKGVLKNTDMITSNKRKSSDLVNQSTVAAGSLVKGAPVNKDKSVGVKGLFTKPVSNDNYNKNVTDSKKNILSNNKSSVPVSSSSSSSYGKTYRGGMLANKGSGTMVITQKGNKQTQKKSSDANDPAPHCSVSATVTPFVGKGYTIGSTSISQPMPAAKPWLSLLDRIEADRKKMKHLSSLTIGKISTTKMIKNNEVTQSESRIENSSGSVQSPPKKFKNSPLAKPFFTKNSVMDSHNKSHRNSDNNSHAQSPANDNLEVMVNCPNCGKLMEEHAINSHLDICLQHDVKERPVSVNVANCPVCSKDFPLSEINCHIDLCLFNNDDSTSATVDEEDELIKCPMCDDKLLKSALDVHLESCILCITKTDPSFIGDCDSEFNDASGAGECGEDLHPCPLCMKLVKENLMSIHLDNCLSADILKEITQE